MANYEEKTVLMDEATSKRAISRIAYEIVERNRGTENLYYAIFIYIII